MTTIVVMPGGFHPFHAGHMSLYNSARRVFPDAEVYVAATNDTSSRPFPFAVKEKLAKLAGVAPGKFIQVKSPFKANEVTDHFDPEQDVLIFVRSEKDAKSQPLPGGVKKDGSASYLQPLLGAKKLEPFAKHAYMAYLPTVEFGPGMTSATQIRSAWPTLNEKRKTALVMSLYPKTQGNVKLAATVVKLLDAAIGGEQGVAEVSLTEFAPGAGGDGDRDEDPYKYPKPESYRRSADFFGKFEAGHFDSEDFDDATGVFKGYWGPTQIAYFKFANPAKTSSEDPGIGWYYEPESSASNDTTNAKPAAFGNSEQRKQQELGMIDAFLKSGQTPTPGSQIYSLMKRHGMAEGAPIVVALAPIDVRNPKKAPQPYRNQGDIVPPTTPPSTEKRGVKGRLGQRPMPKYDEGVAEAAKKCPPATQDITINLNNRQKAINEYGYGPLNPDLPNTKFWMKKVDEWNLDSMEEAQSSLCGNCAAFDIRQDTLDCIAQGIDSDSPEDAEGVIDAGDLGYCKFLKFKCASRRTCDAWVTGGPLADKPVDENQGWAATYETNAQNFVGGMKAGYQARENQPVDEASDYIEEKWSAKYKSSINCANPKGFSQKAHCAGRKK
jgi:hypothetical protein